MVCVGEPDLRDATAAIVASAGYIPCAVVRRGTSLVDLVADVAPAVLVLDLTLTGTDGLATLAAVKARSPWTDIILSSPLDMVPVAAFEAGASYVVREGDVAAIRRALSDIASSEAEAVGTQRTNAPLW